MLLRAALRIQGKRVVGSHFASAQTEVEGLPSTVVDVMHRLCRSYFVHPLVTLADASYEKTLERSHYVVEVVA